MIALTQKEFIKKARNVHGNKYSYTETVFTRCSDKVTISCKIHGDFNQRAGSHIEGKKCPKCAQALRKENLSKPRPYRQIKLTTFLARAKKAHGNKYDYTQVRLSGSQQKVRIVCTVHGPFLQSPNNHCSGKGCPKCGYLDVSKYKTRPDISKVKQLLRKMHPTIDVQNVQSNVLSKEVECRCIKHGIFQKKLSHLLLGKGCNECTMEAFYKRRTYTTAQFIEKATLKFGDYYDYSKVKYKDCSNKLTIGCPVHGYFQTSGKLHLSNPGGRCCPGFKKTSRVILGSKTFTVLSAAEAHALRFIFKHTDIKPSSINDRSHGGLPIIHGNFGASKRYLPDFYVEDRNLVIEVKAPGTFGITPYGFMNQSPLDLIRTMQKKAIATLDSGYDFDLYIMDKANRVVLPKNWMFYTPKGLKALFNQTR